MRLFPHLKFRLHAIFTMCTSYSGSVKEGGHGMHLAQSEGGDGTAAETGLLPSLWLLAARMLMHVRMQVCTSDAPKCIVQVCALLMRALATATNCTLNDAKGL